ncbi:MAG: hypothetical protein U1D67_06705 [Dehalococcoidia bacterium]|nr:hypothetical protein [Dehalococcoidia bacterium]
MTLEELLKTTNSRVSVDGDKWMYFNEVTGEWIVLERRAYAKKNKYLYIGTNLNEAIGALTK